MAVVPREPVTAKFISDNCNFLPFSSNPLFLPIYLALYIQYACGYSFVGPCLIGLQ